MNARVPAAAEFAPALLAWHRRHGRHALPWQRARTAYRVWVSEIMLQQTQVATVIPYYDRFMAQFPDLPALAGAPLDAVLHAWSGLGYYARARNLHRAAKVICDAHAGEFPRSHDAMVALPGIGRSTAGAILALAFDERHPILDGNVKRVLARWFGVDGFPGEARVANILWALSEAVTPTADAADYTQAIMDLGATLCTRTQPACERCPVSAGCVARRDGRVGELPTPRPRRERPQRAVFWLVLRRGETVLLEQRPPAGIWGGLWAFPEFASRELAESRHHQFVAAASGDGALHVGSTIQHSFTHFDLTITPLVADVAELGGSVMEGPAQTWYNSRTPARLGLAAPVARLLRADAATPEGIVS